MTNRSQIPLPTSSPRILSLMRVSRFAPILTAFAVLCLLPVPHLYGVQTAGQDMHNAGTDTKNAANDTGHAVKRTTKRSYHKTKHATKHATAETKSGTSKAYDKTKEGSAVGRR